MITPQHARSLIMRHGWNSTAYQILNPGIEHWAPPDQSAVVGYVRHAAWVATGAPVCDQYSLASISHQFKSAAASHNRRVCYFAAGTRLLQAIQSSSRHSAVAIGAQPVWNPLTWPHLVASNSAIRAQINRARNHHVHITPCPPQIARTLPGIHLCLNRWLASRPMPPLRFMTDPRAFLGFIQDRQLLLATRGSSHDAPIIGFLLASPVPQRNGFLIEQIVRDPSAPNGTAELLIHSAMQTFAAQHCTYATLGLVALATQSQPSIAQNPAWLRLLMNWARAHGRRFYNFEGLEKFRAKLCPQEWESIYAITNEPRFSSQSLFAIAQAFSATSPFTLLLHSLSRALLQESRWLLTSLRPLPPA